MSPWLWLFLAGLAEIGWGALLKSTHGFTKFWPSVMTLGFMVISFVCLSKALQHLPLGVAYAVWTGIGAVGLVVIGALWHHETLSLSKVFFIGLIIVGIAGLKLAD